MTKEDEEPIKMYPGVMCQQCGAPNALKIDDPANIPEEFHLECGRCGHQTTYQRAEVQRLQASPKQ